MRRIYICSLHLFASLALLAADASSDVTLQATDFGFYHDQLLIFSDTNHANGWYPGANPPGELRSFFVFDLTAVSGTITTATLRAGNSPSGFASPDPAETLGLFDVDTNLDSLTSGSGGLPAFADLGTGVGFGTEDVDFTDNDSVVEVTLNAAGVAALNDAIGSRIGIGLALTTINFAQMSASERMFNASAGPDFVREIVLAPEPGRGAGVAVAGAALLALRRRSAQSAAESD